MAPSSQPDRVSAAADAALAAPEVVLVRAVGGFGVGAEGPVAGDAVLGAVEGAGRCREVVEALHPRRATAAGVADETLGRCRDQSRPLVERSPVNSVTGKETAATAPGKPLTRRDFRQWLRRASIP